MRSLVVVFTPEVVVVVAGIVVVFATTVVDSVRGVVSTHQFLQHVSIACYAERCISYDRFCPSV